MCNVELQERLYFERSRSSSVMWKSINRSTVDRHALKKADFSLKTARSIDRHFVVWRYLETHSLAAADTWLHFEVRPLAAFAAWTTSTRPSGFQVRVTSPLSCNNVRLDGDTIFTLVLRWRNLRKCDNAQGGSRTTSDHRWTRHIRLPCGREKAPSNGA